MNVIHDAEQIVEYYIQIGKIHEEAKEQGVDDDLVVAISKLMPADVLATLAPTAPYESVAARAIRRALAQAQSPLPDQAPAVECAIVLHCGGLTIQGSLSETEDGGLRMMSQLGAAGPDGVPMIEQFFGYYDVAVVGFPKRVLVDRPRILHPA